MHATIGSLTQRGLLLPARQVPGRDAPIRALFSAVVATFIITGITGLSLLPSYRNTSSFHGSKMIPAGPYRVLPDNSISRKNGYFRYGMIVMQTPALADKEDTAWVSGPRPGGKTR